MHRLLICGLVCLMLGACDSGESVESKSAAEATAAVQTPESGPVSEGAVVVAGATKSTTAAAPAATAAPAGDQAKAKASPEQAALVEAGQELFEDNCEACHQADAIGAPGIAPSLTTPELLSIASDTFLISTITDGRDGTSMTGFGEDLTVDEIKSIVVYLRSHETEPNRSAQVDAQPNTHGDPRFGKQWFGDICSTCHGVNGDGYEAGGTGTAIGFKGFLGKASDGFIRETIKYGRSNTRMRGFSSANGLANLSDQEIDDIIAYLHVLGEKNAAAAAAEDDDDE